MRLPRLQDLPTALRDPKRWRGWALEALILVAVVAGVAAWQNRSLPAGAAPPLAGVRSDGAAVKLGPGEAATLVVFWATWCPVCQAEAGNIETIARDWPVISVAMQSGDRAEVAGYLAAEGLRAPAIADDDGDISGLWRVRGVPTHFILDPAGNIRFRVVGYATEWGLRFRLWWASRLPAEANRFCCRQGCAACRCPINFASRFASAAACSRSSCTSLKSRPIPAT